jgi:hypothetical protein
MRKIASCVILAALLGTGCGDLLSLHPLYTDPDRVFDTAFEGRWENDDEFVLVNRSESTYRVTIQSKTDASDKSEFEAVLVDVKGVRFVDLIPEDGVGHMFLKARVADSRLHLAFFDSEWLRRRIPHEDVEVARGKKQAMLTGRTPQVRKLVEQYALEPKAYDDEIVLRRARPSSE